MPTFEQSPCIDCLVYVKCRNRFIDRLKEINNYGTGYWPNEKRIAEASFRSVMQDCTSFCIFVAGLTNREDDTDRYIYNAAIQSFKNIPGVKK
jgi:hypothetical protein